MAVLLDVFEWYVTECTPSQSQTIRLGPLASEDECRTVVDSLKGVPRFSNLNFEFIKRRKRRDQRFRRQYAIRVYRPVSQDGVQAARTINISASGARLDRLAMNLNPGEVLTIECNGREAPFQVIWVGSGAIQGQAGVECLAPEVNIWSLDLHRPDEEEVLLGELERARIVQSRLLPQEMPFLQTLEYDVLCIPARSVGGDYYDFLPSAPGEVGFVLADVSGKGMAAALLMANLQGSLRAQCPFFQNNLSGLLAAVNKHLYQHTDNESFATAFVGFYNDQTRILRYVNCGHNPPLVLHCGTGFERLAPTATVLGLFSDWNCAVAEVKLQLGDTLSIYTDGVTEAQNKDGDEFGETRFLDVLRDNSSLDLSQLINEVAKRLKTFDGGEQTDDVTLIVARSTLRVITQA